MSTSTLLAIFILSAIVFAFVYSPVFKMISKGLVSQYTKADLKSRFLAATIDGLMVVTTIYLYIASGFFLYLAVGIVYLLLRDAIKGRSVGKFLLWLVVISIETGHTSSLAGTARRNLILLLPGANVVAIFLETRTLIHDPQGQRLGDRIAQTQVIEGFGAKDLIKSFQDRLMGRLGAEMGSPVKE